MAAPFRFSFIDMEVLGAYTHSISDIAKKEDFAGMLYWDDFVTLRKSVREGAVTDGWTCTNLKEENKSGHMAVNYKADGRVAHTWPAHEWANEMLPRLVAIAKKKLSKEDRAAYRWVTEDSWDTYAAQAAAFGLEPNNLYRLVECAAFGAPDDKLVAALTSKDPNAAVLHLFGKEFTAFTKFVEHFNLTAKTVTMPAFADLAKLAATEAQPPTVYDRTHPSAANVLNQKVIGTNKRRRSSGTTVASNKAVKDKDAAQA